MKSSHRNALVTIICVVMAGAAGCATPVKSTALIVKDAQIQKQHQHSVRISVEGGGDYDSLGIPSIPNDVFAEAVADSIVKSKLFSEVKKGEGGDYLLSIHVFNIEQQLFGFNMTSRMEVGWTLADAATNKQVLRKTIKSSYTATAGKAFAAVTRIRLATEGAARNNIKEGLEEISKLDL